MNKVEQNALFVVTVAIVVSSAAYVVYTDIPTVYLMNGNITAEENSSTYIMIENAENIKGVYINLSFDASVVNIEDIKSVDFSTTSYKNINNERGYVGFAAVNNEPLSGEIKFAEVIINTGGDGKESTQIKFNSLTVNDGVEEVRSRALDGVIKIN
ncbi:MAG: hypothetical protein SVJ22_05460 [Halobacteriota archaeon]|nr:hypothetical protein [Halobacteriota archaeon]